MVPMEARGPEMPSERAERVLRERLAADEWKTGEALPTLDQLAVQLGVARGTVATVLRRLAAEGLVITRARWGRFKA